MPRTLSAPVTVAFDYTRSTGPVLGRFLSGLRDGVVLGARTSQGQVVVPPPEFDPITHAPVDDFVEVADTGTVTSWSWVPEPVKGQPFERPFAFALVTLDGADAPLLHALDVPSPDDVTTGVRVRIRWRAERVGAITDIECFEPAVAEVRGAPATSLEAAAASARSETPEVSRLASLAPQPPAVTGIVVPIELDYLYAASPEESLFYTSLSEGSWSASGARPAARSTSHRAAPARPTGPPPRKRWSSPTPARSRPSESSTSRSPASGSRRRTFRPTSFSTARTSRSCT